MIPRMRMTTASCFAVLIGWLAQPVAAELSRAWRAQVFYGSPPDQHEKVEKTVATLIQGGQARGPLNVQDLDLQGVKAEAVRHKGRDAIRLIEVDPSRRAGLAVVKGATFTNGEIAVDVAGLRGPYAQPDDRGFVGVAFRISPEAERFEYLYIRPENGRAEDQVRRNHATQYASHPDFPFSRSARSSPNDTNRTSTSCQGSGHRCGSSWQERPPVFSCTGRVSPPLS